MGIPNNMLAAKICIDLEDVSSKKMINIKSYYSIMGNIRYSSRIVSWQNKRRITMIMIQTKNLSNKKESPKGHNNLINSLFAENYYISSHLDSYLTI